MLNEGDRQRILNKIIIKNIINNVIYFIIINESKLNLFILLLYTY